MQECKGQKALPACCNHRYYTAIIIISHYPLIIEVHKPCAQILYRCTNIYSHFGQHVAHHSAAVVLGNVGELGPGEGVVEVVLHLIVLWKTQQIAVLHVQQVLRLGRGEGGRGGGRGGERSHETNPPIYLAHETSYFSLSQPMLDSYAYSYVDRIKRTGRTVISHPGTSDVHGCSVGGELCIRTPRGRPVPSTTVS